MVQIGWGRRRLRQGAHLAGCTSANFPDAAFLVRDSVQECSQAVISSHRGFASVPEKYRRCSDRTDAGNKLRRHGYKWLRLIWLGDSHPPWRHDEQD
jgi:hypothetical protein